MMLSLSSGVTRVKTFTDSTFARRALSSSFESSSPVSAPWIANPISSAIFFVTKKLSPVTILIATLCSAIFLSVSLTVFFGGSRNARNPTNATSVSSDFPYGVFLKATFLVATPSTRNPSLESASYSLLIAFSVSPPSVECLNISSGAPLAMSTVSLPFFTTTDSNFRSRSNGTSSTFSQPLTSTFLCSWIALSSTPRMPVRCCVLKYPQNSTSSLSLPVLSTHFTSVMRSSVSVPVLSVQSTSTLPKLWIAASFFTITPP